jgi:hypothetical protein
VPPAIESDREFIIDLYKNVLKIDAETEDLNGIAHWEHRLKSDLDRQKVYEYFVNTALQENQKNTSISFEELLSKDDEGKRILFALPENEVDVFNSTSLLKFIQDKYPDHNIYYATQKENFSILYGNKYIHKLLEYNPVMENFAWSEGQGDYNGMFEFVLLPHINTHKIINYIHGGKNKIDYDLNYA